VKLSAKYFILHIRAFYKLTRSEVYTVVRRRRMMMMMMMMMIFWFLAPCRFVDKCQRFPERY
jgi:hypothetical protein